MGLQDHTCQHLIAVGLAAPQLLARDRCGPPRTSTGESLSAVGLAGPQPGLSAVGLAGHQPARFGALWASPDLNRPGRMSERLPDRMPDRMSDRMPDARIYAR